MIGLVHLVWGPLGTAPLRDFLASYQEHPAGTDHELIVLFNGVDERERERLVAELEGVDHRPIATCEPLQDLAAYGWASERLQHERLCFLNSYSTILADGWLAKLSAALDRPGVGLAGATGSWASLRSLAALMHFLPSGYRGAMSRRAVIELSREIEGERGPVAGSPPQAPAGRGEACLSGEAPVGAATGSGASRICALARALSTTVIALPATSEQLLRFQGFPDHHLRSNGFIVERERFAAMRAGPMRRKLDAYAFESGRASITRQVERAGLHALVVDREGDCHEQRDWSSSHTLWQGQQERLLIADNQTRMYANGDLQRRRTLSAMAWGARAEANA